MKILGRFLLIFLCLVPAFASAEMTKLELAQSYFEKKSYKKCITVCDKILDREPRMAEAFYWKGRALEAQKKPLEAANEYQAAVRARADYQEAKDGLSRVNVQLGKDPVVESPGSANQ